MRVSIRRAMPSQANAWLASSCDAKIAERVELLFFRPRSEAPTPPRIQAPGHRLISVHLFVCFDGNVQLPLACFHRLQPPAPVTVFRKGALGALADLGVELIEHHRPKGLHVPFQAQSLRKVVASGERFRSQFPVHRKQ